MSSPSTPSHVIAQIRGRVGCITLDRPKALNALSLDMVRDMAAALADWRENPLVLAVAVRGNGKDGPFGAFCAGGDIRFFHQAALAGDPTLEDFFSEEYALDHLIHTYPKPFIAFMDGVCMGGGMGIAQGASLRMVTERSRLAMPETGIGLFPDVGGGYFLSRCPGRLGEYLALTGLVFDGALAHAAGLADGVMDSARQSALWESLEQTPYENGQAVERWCAGHFHKVHVKSSWPQAEIDQVFALESVSDMVQALETMPSDWARDSLALLRKRSPLMLQVALLQVRRARGMGLADVLRMERDLVRNCFHLRPGASSETVEGIRALAVDKDHQPRWNPPTLQAVSSDMVESYFTSPWAQASHPLRSLA